MKSFFTEAINKRKIGGGTMVDLHSHIIFGVDDGSKSKDMTINMLKQAVEGGTKKLVLTPHYLPGYYEVPINQIKERTKELKSFI